LIRTYKNILREKKKIFREDKSKILVAFEGTTIVKTKDKKG